MLGLLVCVPALAGGYPRIANLWGVSPQSTEYDRLAKYALLVSGSDSAAAWRRFSGEMRRRNPDIILLGTAPLMNIGAPGDTPWMRPEWYLKRPDGQPVKWWADQIYAPNLFVDACLDALVEQTEKSYGALLTEGILNGVFYDSVVGWVTWYGDVDTDGDGQAEDPAEVNPRWQARQNLFFDRLREKYPGMLILANDVNTEHAPHLHGRLFEGAALLDRLLTGALAPRDAMRTLNEWMTTSRQPGITFAIMTHPAGWQGWRVGKGSLVTTPGEQERVRREFRRMRLGLCTALMTDAYYAYDFGTVWYGMQWWYAEYDAPLGNPLGPAREVFGAPPVTLLDWQAGQPIEGLILDAPARETPEGIQAEEADPNAGWQRLFATDFRKVPFEPGRVYRVRASVQIIRQPTQALQFNLRTPTGGWQHHDKGVEGNRGPDGSTWDIDVTVIPDDFPDYAAEVHLLGGGAVRLRSLKVEQTNQAYWVREFEGGMVVLNPLPMPITVTLPRPMRRLEDDAAPRHVIEVDDHEAGFRCDGAWERRGQQGHYAGSGYRVARKPGGTARWRFTAPAEDTYTVLATIPGGKDLTDAAAYQVAGPADGAWAVVDQRPRDGGWTELFQVKLAAGQECEVILHPSGAGFTAADAIRVESATRYNDGAVVESIVLDALDGMVLVNP